MVPSAGHASLMLRSAAAEAAGVGGAFWLGAGAAARLLLSTRSTWPLAMRFGFDRLFSRISSDTVVLCWRAILVSVSPDCTRYCPGPTLVELHAPSNMSRPTQHTALARRQAGEFNGRRGASRVADIGEIAGTDNVLVRLEKTISARSVPRNDVTGLCS